MPWYNKDSIHAMAKQAQTTTEIFSSSSGKIRKI
jgi:hypothetical protein